MRRKTILLMEGHEDSRNICSTILRHFGYGVVEVGDGESGVQLARQHPPDLVVLDIVLPVLDGWTAAQAIRQHAPTSRVPIIALTTRAFREDVLRGEQFGFAAYLIKPCSPRNVLAEVRRVIGSPEADPIGA
jgi:two-component system, cell cycle response regulator DivK